MISVRDRWKLALGLGGAVALSGTLAAPVAAAPLSRWERDGEAYLGRANAPLVLLEYASLTCMHCAAFHAQVLPALKQRFIDTGRVRYVYRPLLTAPPELSGALYVAADCGPRARRFAVIDAFMRQQDAIFGAYEAGDALAVVAGISQTAGGASEAQIRACLADTSRVQPLRESGSEAVRLYGIESTPGLVLNGVKVPPGADGGHSIESVSAFIEATERASRQRRRR
jgi:protein-disulfide isomerase